MIFSQTVNEQINLPNRNPDGSILFAYLNKYFNFAVSTSLLKMNII